MNDRTPWLLIAAAVGLGIFAVLVCVLVWLERRDERRDDR